MPNISIKGPVSVNYSLEEPEFYTSYLKTQPEPLYFLIGLIITVVLFIKYSIKALKTVPNSPNHGHIIPHIFAIKTGALILYPTYT